MLENRKKIVAELTNFFCSGWKLPASRFIPLLAYKRIARVEHNAQSKWLLLLLTNCFVSRYE